MTTFEKLTALLDGQLANYKRVEHAPCGKCEEVAAIRGTAISQGAKALVCHVKGNGVKQYVLAVLPADQQADLSKVANAVGGLRASLASPAEVDRLTGCVFGAIPPFSFHDELQVVVDPTLCERNREIAFNAGRLETSIVLDAQDYQRIGRFTRADIRK
ncbi:YbaK/prolyl-tRNA synthetase associated domain-containing protein [Erwinia endophytica]|uniref:YbaK/prolyl-tRNA synthetase associated domain-containing protein n=1 Tax=Erwinia endophytica TaxID=1563158 RepID=UPI001265FE40|nr:YbaK/prolyl-tRNA synthetase associated domain-containing protein [Erwinia endophytica]KAB8307368.1 YbaK/prolyl-tRNA synthetase associated domain-containing protein [Erwinia endophytica]